MHFLFTCTDLQKLFPRKSHIFKIIVPVSLRDSH